MGKVGRGIGAPQGVGVTGRRRVKSYQHNLLARCALHGLKDSMQVSSGASIINRLCHMSPRPNCT